MKTSHFILLLLGLSLPIACDEERCSEVTPSARRTVLVYLAGDNNLSDEVWEKVDALVFAWQNPQDNLLVYQDTRGERGTPSLMKVVCEAGHSYTEVVKEYPDANSADPQVFSEVLRDAVSGFPAPSCGLLLFSHGTGWLPSGSYSDPHNYPAKSTALRSLIDDTGREMEIADFAAAIPDGQFDFIVLEACLMASVEVAFELRDKTDYLLASSAEILSPGFTPVYGGILPALFAQPEAALTEAAACYYTYCNNLEAPYRSATVSVIRTDRMKKLAEAMKKVYAVLPDEFTPAVIREIQCFDRSDDRLFFDLGSLIASVSTTADTEGRSAAEQAKQALQEAVVYRAATPFFVNLSVSNHSGLTVYLGQAAYPALNAAWKKTGWYKCFSAY
mgnify:CR=1 FL=1